MFDPLSVEEGKPEDSETTRRQQTSKNELNFEEGTSSSVGRFDQIVVVGKHRTG